MVREMAPLVHPGRPVAREREPSQIVTMMIGRAFFRPLSDKYQALFFGLLFCKVAAPDIRKSIEQRSP
jgi:hypothetical protein